MPFGAASERAKFICCIIVVTDRMINDWLFIITYLFCCDLVVTLGRKKLVSPTLARCGGGEPGCITGNRSLVLIRLSMLLRFRRVMCFPMCN